MAGNLISLLVVLGLVGFFGWLTIRAWRARRWYVKWPGMLVSGVLTLLLAAIVFFSGKALLLIYTAPAPVPAVTVAGTPEQIARGEYLVRLSCVVCHGSNDNTDFPLSGLTDFSAEFPLPMGKVVTPNITPGGVLPDLSDGELFRLLRYGYGRDERAAFMTFSSSRSFSDEDTLAVIAFLRSQQPVTTASNGGSDLNLLGNLLFFGLGVEPLPETIDGPISAPPAGPTAAYGAYVATLGECVGCHGPQMTGAAATALLPSVPNPRPLVGTLSAEQFIAMMRTGIRPDNRPFPEEMPWEIASRMTDEDLTALYAYLTAAP